MMAERLLSTSEVARRLDVQANTLAKWRSVGLGPAFLRLGGRAVRYRESDVDAWLASCSVTPERDR